MSLLAEVKGERECTNSENSTAGWMESGLVDDELGWDIGHEGERQDGECGEGIHYSYLLSFVFNMRK